MELWTHRIDSLFLDAFGRPDANQDPPCERTGETTVVQALHLMNAPSVNRQVTSDDGRVARLAASRPLGGTDRRGALPGDLLALADKRRTSGHSPADRRHRRDRRQAVEDLLWALLNTPEFVFKN